MVQIFFPKFNTARLCSVVSNMSDCRNDPGAPSSIPAWSHSYVVIDHEIISMAILLPSPDPRMFFYYRSYI